MKKNNLLEKITIIYFYLQPILDVIAAFLINNNYSNVITNTIRLIFALFIFIELLIKKYDNKKRVLLYLLVMTIYLITTLLIRLKLTNMYYFLFDLKNSISTFYVIILLIGFNNLYKNEIISNKHLKNVWVIYLLLTFIPSILNIGFDSYAYAKLGNSGWFYSANVVGSIIILIIPIIYNYLLKENKIYIIISLPILIYILLTLGTKAPILGFVIIISFNLIYLLLRMIKKGKKKQLLLILSTIIIIMITSIIVIPKTNFYKNLEIHYNFLKEKNVEIKSKEFLDHFVFSQRLTFAEKTKKNYDNSKIVEKIFGIGYTENAMKENESTKTIEIDYLDIFYRHGIIGFIIFFIPVIYIITDNIKNKKISLNYILAITLILLLALFQGHVFITPAISIFVALILVNKNIIQSE